MIQLNQINKSMFGKTLFKNVTTQINDGKKIALVGDNGTGKSTLLKIMADLERIDSGSVSISKDQKLSYLEQASVIETEETVYDFIYNGQKEIKKLHQLLTELEEKLADISETDFEKTMNRYGQLQEEFMQKNGYVIEESIMSIATGLGIKGLLSKKIATLSGGEQTLVKLARCLLENHDILLLDEPTNHLDVKGLNWLENHLKYSKQTVVIVSHDRYFLDQVAEEVMLLENLTVKHYVGNYTKFKEQRDQELLIQEKDFLTQQKERKQIEDSIRRFRDWGAISDNEKHFKKAKRLEKQLETMEVIDKPTKKELKSSQQFIEKTRSGKEVIKLENVSQKFNDQNVFLPINTTIFWQDRLAISGANGSGKSTLIKLILKDINPSTGQIKVGDGVTIGYLPQVIIYQNNKQTVLGYFKEHVELIEEDARRILAHFHFFKEDVFKEVGKLSGGEKVRLELACLMNQAINCLILDEPTNHLDISTREWLEKQLVDFNGTLVMVSHDRYFVKRLATKKLEIKKS